MSRRNDPSVTSVNLAARELATVLASLRKWQRDIDGEEGFYPGLPGHWGSEFFADCRPLTLRQIDQLCRRMNIPATTQILVEIDGGVCQAVFAENPATEVILFDRDNIAAGDELPCDYEATVKYMAQVF